MIKSLLKATLRAVLKSTFAPYVPIAAQRRAVERIALLSPSPPSVRRKRIDMNGVTADLITGKLPRLKHAVLYFHGGGYCIGSPYTHRIITGGLAKELGIPVYAPDYRLAPEHPHPAALDDALAAYRWLIADGYLPQCIAVAGDSAGGGLALSLCLALRAAGERLPKVVALLSPWVDLACTGESYTQLEERDPVLTPAGLRRWARDYLADLAPDHPACSPIYAELGGLPPMLIQVGSEEVVLSDAQRLERQARASGVDVRLHQFDGMWHDFQLHLGVLRESAAALKEIAAFVREHLGSQEARAA